VRWVYLIAGATLLGVVSFAVTWSAGPVITVVWSLIAGGLSLLFVRLIDSHSAGTLGELAPMLMAGLVVGLAGLLKWMTGASTDWWADGVGILSALGGAWGLEAALPTGEVGTCGVCRRPVGREPSWTCPRCKLLVCARPDCWIARHFRCRNCHEKGINLFPIGVRGWSADERWWRSRIGARVTAGSCNGPCLEEAAAADLRECGRCGWPMCTRCWDYHNGQCQRPGCGWIIPDLPQVLRPFLRSSEPVTRGRTAAERRRS
jgi:hypothetical protein